MQNLGGKSVTAFYVFDSEQNKIATFETDDDDYSKIILQDGDKFFVYKEVGTHRHGVLAGYHEVSKVVKVSFDNNKSTPIRNCWNPSTWK